MTLTGEMFHFRTFTADEAARAKGIVGYARSALSSAFVYRIGNGIDRD